MAACHLLIARVFSRTNSEILTSIFTPSALGVNLTVDIAFFASEKNPKGATSSGVPDHIHFSLYERDGFYFAGGFSS
jgi:hypothetical protein